MKAPHRPEAPRAPAGSPVALAAIALACLLPLVWPGDVPFINDEPLLIAHAVAANGARQPASFGLPGTYGFIYGPVPTWAYQMLLPISHDLVVVAALHALLFSAATAAALWWLSKSLRLWIWFGALPLVSPYFWFYARVLWDNPFLIPLGAFAMAGYAALLDSGSSVGLRVAVASLVLIPLVHLMGIALVVPLAVHMLLFRGKALWHHKFSVGAIAIGALVLARPYWLYLASSHSPAPSAGWTSNGWLFPLAGGRLLGASGLDYFFGAEPIAGPVFEATSSISLIAHVLVWTGIVMAVFQVARALRTRDWSPRAHIAAIAIAAVASQVVIDGVSAKFEHPHYQNGTWIAFVLFAWFAVDAALCRKRIRWGAVAVTALICCASIATVVALLLRLHRSGGTREVYGPTLGNQQRVAKALSEYAPASEVQCRVIACERFPHALATLRELNPGRRLDRPRRSLEVRYASGDPRSGVIGVVERGGR